MNIFLQFLIQCNEPTMQPYSSDCYLRKWAHIYLSCALLGVFFAGFLAGVFLAGVFLDFGAGLAYK